MEGERKTVDIVKVNMEDKIPNCVDEIPMVSSVQDDITMIQENERKHVLKKMMEVYEMYKQKKVTTVYKSHILSNKEENLQPDALTKASKSALFLVFLEWKKAEYQEAFRSASEELA